jgi:NAD(P)-dependent dehydrogenase (short-subunit alcohol dehydrogenase family)
MRSQRRLTRNYDHRHRNSPYCRRAGTARSDRHRDRRQLDARRKELRATLPIGRVVGPADVAAPAVHMMINTAITGATYDIDGGQQFVE